MADRNYTQYVYGNAVRQFEPVPKQSIPQEMPNRERQRQERLEREQRQRQEAADRRQMRLRRRAVAMSRKYTMFFAIAMAVTCASVGGYVYMKAQLENHLDQISTLESQIESLRTENDEALRRVEASVDIEEIREKAINKLGMTYPKKSQVKYYHVDDADYMVQYDDIPQQSEGLFSLFSSK
jgi:cell division protein FtsL